ncbi:MAG: universal stress protein [Acidobacteriaceae bacterium]
MSKQRSEFPSFLRILMATDCSRVSGPAFCCALDLAQMFHSKLTVQKIVEPAETDLPESPASDAFLDPAATSAVNAPSGLVSHALARGIDCEVSTESGNPTDAILRQAKTTQADLIVLGVESTRAYEPFPLETIIETVLRKAPCPVLAFGPISAAQPPRRPHSQPVLFATDFHRTTTAAIAYAAALADSFHTELHCLHVLPRALQSTQKMQVIPTILTCALRQVACSVMGNPVCSVTFGSEVSHAIVEYAREHDAATVVLGVRQASMTGSALAPPIAYRVIAEAPCPVLTVPYGKDFDQPTTYIQ